MPASESPQHPAARLRAIISGRKTVAVPGVFNPAVALLAQQAGFECLYLSGAAFANSMGLPDLGVTTLTEVVEMTDRIASAAPSTPLIVDADTGFGEAVNVGRAVRMLERAGAAGLQIEDQVMPKRCGHLEGKELVEPEEMVKKLVAAKASSRRGIVLVGRTDAAETEGLEGAVERARLYRKAGADVIFPEALRSKQEFAEFAKKVKGPLLANMTEFGKTPYLSVEDFAGLEGYKLVVFPVTTFRAAMSAMRDVLDQLARSGSQKGSLKKLMTRDEFNDLVGYKSYAAADESTSRKAGAVTG